MLIGTCGASAIFSSRKTKHRPASKEKSTSAVLTETRLVFVEVRTRAREEGKSVLPELSITPEKHRVFVRTAHYFLRERHFKESRCGLMLWPSTKRLALPQFLRLHRPAVSSQARQG